VVGVPGRAGGEAGGFGKVEIAPAGDRRPAGRPASAPSGSCPLPQFAASLIRRVNANESGLDLERPRFMVSACRVLLEWFEHDDGKIERQSKMLFKEIHPAT
jgi:hypothetical protein